jgi:hypothetical protein
VYVNTAWQHIHSRESLSNVPHTTFVTIGARTAGRRHRRPGTARDTASVPYKADASVQRTSCRRQRRDFFCFDLFFINIQEINWSKVCLKSA